MTELEFTIITDESGRVQVIGDIVSDGTAWGSDEWYAARWASVPEDMKEQIVYHLRQIKNFDEMVVAKDDPFFHMWGGMQVRNYLRKVVLDSDLPPAPYPEGKSYQNWDDYYDQAIEAAADDTT